MSACSNMAEGEALYDHEEEKQENNLEDIPTDMSDTTEDSDGISLARVIPLMYIGVKTQMVQV